MISIYHFYILATSALVCTILIPFVARLSVRVGALDHPDERKVHQHATPRLGGIAIFCSLLFTLICFCPMDQQIKGLLAGAIIIFLTGLADDLTGLTPYQKFIGEFLAAGLAVFMGGITVLNLGDPLGLGIIELGPLAVPFTLFGIVGLINGINLLDGLDGLAAGVCAISCVAFGAISFVSGNSTMLILNVALLGSLLGFLRYNHFPAHIFMGDCGSLLLGYCMGVFAVLLASGGIQPVSPYIPLLVLAVPVMDTLVVMVNRKRLKKRLFMPDMSHFHHRLLETGLGHRATVVIVYSLSYLAACVAIFGLKFSDSILVACLLVATLLAYGGLTCLKYGVFQNQLGRVNKSTRYVGNRLRLLVHQTKALVIAIKYLLLATLLLPVFISKADNRALWMITALVLIVAAATYLSRYTWKSLLLQCSVYLCCSYIVFVVENYGREEQLFGLPLLYVSHAIFLLLLMAVGIKVMIRKRISKLVVSSYEYLVALTILSVPLFPTELTGQFHLLTVAAKSMVLFVAFKLVLVRQFGQNRKILLVIVFSALILVLRRVMGM